MDPGVIGPRPEDEVKEMREDVGVDGNSGLEGVVIDADTVSLRETVGLRTGPRLRSGLLNQERSSRRAERKLNRYGVSSGPLLDAGNDSLDLPISLKIAFCADNMDENIRGHVFTELVKPALQIVEALALGDIIYHIMRSAFFDIYD